MRLTDLSIRKLPVPVKGQKTYWEDGFGVRVSQGGSKSFVVTHGTPRKLTTLGRYPAMSLKEARSAAKRLQATSTLPPPVPSYQDALSAFLKDTATRARPSTVDGDYTDLVALRNSHDKKFPIGIAAGARVFVCDNLSFIGDHVVKRRHTKNSKRDLPGIVSALVEPLHAERQAQHEKFQTYQNTVLTDRDADHLVMELYRRGVINVQRIANVASEWQNHSHDWGDKSAWRLFNAVTFALTGRMAEKPEASERLHEVIDGVCEPA